MKARFVAGMRHTISVGHSVAATAAAAADEETERGA